MAAKFPIFLPFLLALGSGCGRASIEFLPSTCPAKAGLEVHVVDARTGGKLCFAQVEVRADDYTELLSHAPSSGGSAQETCDLRGLIGGYGVIDMTASNDGYLPRTKTGVRLATPSGCNLEMTVVELRLDPK